MSRRSAVFVLGLWLVALVLLGATAPTWAHTGRSDQISASAIEVTAAMEEGVLPGLVPADTPEPRELLWPAVLTGLIGVAFGWRRPRRALALALVLLLAVFAFEMALHSVHHGADPRHAATCVAAAASAHLAATAVDSVVSVDVILPAVAPAPEIDPSGSLTSSLRPDQGRAPPASI